MMGLLGKIEAIIASGELPEAALPYRARKAIADFSPENPFFHCVILRHGGGQEGLSGEISDLAANHGIVCRDLSDSECILLLPGELDMELFSHRISRSTETVPVFQFSTDSPSSAFATLRSYLEN